jgi:hypothetical protein
MEQVMNERIKELAAQAEIKWQHQEDVIYSTMTLEQLEKFAELIVHEHLHIMKTEWYQLNNMSVDPEGESPRDVGMRVGRKTEVITLMNKVEQHFGVK